jgi:hypothetical protein
MMSGCVYESCGAGGWSRGWLTLKDGVEELVARSFGYPIETKLISMN